MATTAEKIIKTAPVYNVTPNPQTSSLSPIELTRIRLKIRGLAIAEIAIGSICVVVGILAAALSTLVNRFSTTSYFSNTYFYRNLFFTFGEGIWCGIWIIVAGSLGVAAANKNASKCLVKCHLAFGIVAAVFSCILFGLSIFLVTVARLASTSLFIVLIIASSTAGILLIFSSYFSGRLTGCCFECQGEVYSHQHVHTNQTMFFQNIPIPATNPSETKYVVPPSGTTGYPASPVPVPGFQPCVSSDQIEPTSSSDVPTSQQPPSYE